MTNTSAVIDKDVTKDQLLDLYTRMVTIRTFEGKVQELYRGTVIIGIAHVSIGQEAVAVGVCSALRTDDYITSTHRGHGHCLAKGADMGRMFAELFGKEAGYCRGKGGSMHIANQEMGNLGANAIVGGSIPIATGAAFSAKVRKTDQVAVCFFGDGAANQGVLLESMNMAAIWKLPVIYACENNQYGEYTPMQNVTAGKIIERGKAFDIASSTVDGMDVLAVREAALEAVNRGRAGEGPSFLVLETYRHSGHGMSDIQRAYRTREEEREWREKRDPIDRLAGKILTAGQASEAELESIAKEIAAEVEVAVEYAKQSPFPGPEEVTRHVYAD